MIKSLEADVAALALILACKAVSSVVSAVTFVVNLACRAVSSAVKVVVFAARLASVAATLL